MFPSSRTNPRQHPNFSGGTMPRDKRFSCLAAATATCIIAISISLAAPGAPAQATAPPPARTAAAAVTGSIFGNVNDHQGSPLAGAQVTLTNLSTKETTNGSTDGTGAYSFDNLKPGHYSIVFDSKGLISKTHEVDVKPGKKSKISERLKPPEVKEKRNVE
jgi:hypothetical protein